MGVILTFAMGAGVVMSPSQNQLRWLEYCVKSIRIGFLGSTLV